MAAIVSQVPIGLPPGVDPALAQQAIEYLRAHPEEAKKAVEDAQRLLRNPNMANEMMAARKQVCTWQDSANTCPSCRYLVAIFVLWVLQRCSGTPNPAFRGCICFVIYQSRWECWSEYLYITYENKLQPEVELITLCFPT